MKFFSVLILLTALLVGYQNCSIYESEGRSMLNSEGATIYQKSLSSPSAVSCDMYFAPAFLQEVFGPIAYQSVFHINAKQEVICHIKTEVRDFECKFSADYADLLQNPSNKEYQWLQESPRLSLQYEQAVYKKTNSSELIYILKKDLPEAVGCKTNYQEITLNQDLSLLATLAQSMLEQSLQTRP